MLTVCFILSAIIYGIDATSADQTAQLGVEFDRSFVDSKFYKSQEKLKEEHPKSIHLQKQVDEECGNIDTWVDIDFGIICKFWARHYMKDLDLHILFHGIQKEKLLFHFFLFSFLL